MNKFFLLLISILLFGCSSDNDSKNNNIPSLLLGKWTGEKQQNYGSNGVLKTEYDYSEEECYHMTTIEFKSNYKYIKDSYDFDGKECVKNALNTYDFTYSENKLNINFEQQEVVLNSKSVLILKSVNDDNSYTLVEYSKVD